MTRQTPLEISSASKVQPSKVLAHATDEDGDEMSYLWSASGGTFADPDASSTEFHCEQQGTHSLTVVVSDPGACAATWTGSVSCVE